jgi:PAS domain S-box-containing protein
VQRLSIATRLYLLIGLSTLALGVVIGTALLGSSEMVAAGHNLHDRGAVVVEETSRLALLFEEQEQVVSRASAEIDLNRLREFRTRFDELSEELSARLTRLAPLADALAAKSASRLAALFGEFRAHAALIFDFAQDFLQVKAREVLDGPQSTVAGQIDAILDELLNAAAKTTDDEVEALSNARDKMVWTIAAVSLLGVVTFIGLGIYLARRLTHQLGWIIAEMSALSAGDLDSQLAAVGDPDEIGAMARALEVFRFEMIGSRQMAAELRRSQEHLAHAQRIAHMGSDITNLRTDEAEWSDELYSIFGVTRETYVASTDNFLRMVHPDDRALVLAAREEIKKGICPDPFEYRIIRPDGSLRHIYRENEFLRNEAGNPFSLTGTCQDITEIRAVQERERELEQQLMHSQKLEALGTLAGGVAHDLNNTLVPILALSKLAETIVAQEFPGANILLLTEDGQQVMNTILPPDAPLPVRRNLESTRQVFATGRPAVSNLYQGAVGPRPRGGDRRAGERQRWDCHLCAIADSASRGVCRDHPSPAPSGNVGRVGARPAGRQYRACPRRGAVCRA